MEDIIKNLQGKSIHVVGVTGAEGSSILQFLLKHHLTNITAHDFLESTLEKSFKLWHKGIPSQERNTLFQEFMLNISKVNFLTQEKYLAGLTSADIIFVPQSWRLYKERNRALWDAQKKGIPFYSLTRLYLDFAKATVIGVTGTVGKGSVSHILSQLLTWGGKKVYLAGNDTWRVQLAAKIDEMKKEDILLLEISHRQLQDGFTRAPHIVVFTNLYPNHLDEVSWKDYQDLKFSLLQAQKVNDFSVLNYDSAELRELGKKLKSNVLYFSAKSKDMNTKNVQKLYRDISSIKSIHFFENILAAVTTSFIFEGEKSHILTELSKLSVLPARLEIIRKKEGITFYDDIKSTTPSATLAALEKLSTGSKDIILIAGGRTKGISYDAYKKKAESFVKHTIFLTSQLSSVLIKQMPKGSYTAVDNLSDAVTCAYRMAVTGDKILLSPGASFFYSDFVKGKSSFRKLVISLPPKEQG